MATWFEITYKGEQTEDDYARVAELAAQGFTSGQLINEPDPADEPHEHCPSCGCPAIPPAPVWQCEDCGWTWPLPGKPPEGSECDNCGGEITEQPAG